jgi:hypothetical protein
MKKLLLHTCCAPCLSGTDEALSSEGFDITGYFYNPNIHPEDELARRIEALKKYSELKKFNTIIIDGYDIDLFNKKAVDMSGDRCLNCYKLRLESTAKHAAVNSFDLFSTTLLLSPYQKHDIIRELGEDVSEKYGIEFYYRDMRPFYKDSVRISKEKGLYRQRYCGCYLSREARDEQVSLASK